MSCVGMFLTKVAGAEAFVIHAGWEEALKLRVSILKNLFAKCLAADSSKKAMYSHHSKGIWAGCTWNWSIPPVDAYYTVTYHTSYNITQHHLYVHTNPYHTIPSLEFGADAVSWPNSVSPCGTLYQLWCPPGSRGLCGVQRGFRGEEEISSKKSGAHLKEEHLKICVKYFIH